MRVALMLLIGTLACCSCSDKPDAKPASPAQPSPKTPVNDHVSYDAQVIAALGDINDYCPHLRNVQGLRKAGVSGNQKEGMKVGFVVEAPNTETAALGFKAGDYCTFSLPTPEHSDVEGSPSKCMQLCPEKLSPG